MNEYFVVVGLGVLLYGLVTNNVYVVGVLVLLALLSNCQ